MSSSTVAITDAEKHGAIAAFRYSFVERIKEGDDESAVKTFGDAYQHLGSDTNEERIERAEVAVDWLFEIHRHSGQEFPNTRSRLWGTAIDGWVLGGDAHCLLSPFQVDALRNLTKAESEKLRHVWSIQLDVWRPYFKIAALFEDSVKLAPEVIRIISRWLVHNAPVTHLIMAGTILAGLGGSEVDQRIYAALVPQLQKSVSVGRAVSTLVRELIAGGGDADPDTSVLLDGDEVTIIWHSQVADRKSSLAYIARKAEVARKWMLAHSELTFTIRLAFKALDPRDQEFTHTIPV
jgi:hypothetical protein